MKRQLGKFVTGCLLLLLLVALLAPMASAAVPVFLTSAPEDGQPGAGAGHLDFPWGIATDSSLPGHVYLVGHSNRIDEFTPWGEFVKAFGWKVNATGPEEKLQTCTAASGCQRGTSGPGKGQFVLPEGSAVDSAGNLYILESGNHRVQKFDSAGNFLLMFGDGVNKTAGEEVGRGGEEDICPAAGHPADECQAGTSGSGPGQFGAGNGGYIGRFAISPLDGTIFAGEAERIQKFSSAGVYEESIALPAGRSVRSLAIDGAGNLYVALGGGEVGVVNKLSPNGPTATFLTPSFTADGPVNAVALDGAGNLYATVSAFGNVPNNEPEKVLEFDPTGKCLDCGETGEEGKPGFDRSSDGSAIWAIATGSACGPSDIYTAHFGNGSGGDPLKSYLSAFGPPPNPAVCPQPVRPPEITAQYAVSVGTDGASLRAGINPKFWPDTTYYAEYGTAPCSQGGCKALPAPPGGLLGSAVTNTSLTASVPVSGLAPNTKYFYRFVAQSGGGGPVRGTGGKVGLDGTEASFTTFPLPPALKEDCANQARRWGASAKLADCRAYEMVSPIDKENGEVAVLLSGNFNRPAEMPQGAADGGRLTYSSYRAFGDVKSSPFTSQYLASRDQAAEEWVNDSIAAPREGASFNTGAGGLLDAQFKTFTDDLCSGWLLQDAEPVLAPGGVAGFSNIYRRSNCGAEGFEAITTAKPPTELPSLYAPQLQGFSTQAGLTVFRANDKLTKDASGAKQSNGLAIYQLYASQGGQLQLVSRLPNGEANAGSSAAGSGGNSSGLRDDSLQHAISTDGSRIYWSDLENSSLGPLYLRENPMQAQSKVSAGKCTEAAKACTFAVSASVPGAGPNDASQYWTASPDGAKAIFSLTSGPLAGNLYEYDAVKKSSTLIASKVSGVLGASDDASKIYLASGETLAPGAKAGAANIYLYRAPQGGNPASFALVTSLGSTIVGSLSGIYCDNVTPGPYNRCTRVSPDGDQLAFMTTESPTGYDSTDATSGEADAEVFLYDASAEGGAGKLNCISCNPSGGRPSGRAFQNIGTKSVGVAAQIPSWISSFHAPRALSDDGNRLFFESFDALLSRDTNGKADVYEWESAQNAAQCSQRGAELYVASASGCISLISTGQSELDSQFVDASASGDDVFFKTSESINPEDPGLIDIYDARVNGGFLPKPPPQPPCEGEACQPAPAPPGVLTPASSIFRGAGNPKPPCPKGKHRVTKKGKSSCVANKKKKHKKHKSKASPSQKGAGR